MRLLQFQLAALLFVSAPVAAFAQVRITEFMASNTQTLYDEDGDPSDWIEIQNTSATNVSLLNWALSDSAGDPAQWLFPATNLAAGSFMVVFASGKDRRVPGDSESTRISSLLPTGEYLALADPNGTTATEFSPQYPQQYPDVSYGSDMLVTTMTLIPSNAATTLPVSRTMPSDDATLDAANLNDTSWQTGTNGIGYETGIYDPQEESFYLKMLDTQPVAYWRLNETNGPAAVNSGTAGVEDEAGYIGSLLLDKAGPRPPSVGYFETNNNAPYFNGTNAYVSGPYEMMDDLPAFTIAGWINPMTTPEAAPACSDKTTPSSSASLTPRPQCVDAVWLDQLFLAVSAQPVALRRGGGRQRDAGIIRGRPACGEIRFGEPATLGSRNIISTSAAAASWTRRGIVSPGRLTKWQSGTVRWPPTKSPHWSPPMRRRSDYTNYIATDVQSQMYGCNATAYVRIPFNVADPSALSPACKLHAVRRWLRGLLQRAFDCQLQCARHARVEFYGHAASSGSRRGEVGSIRPGRRPAVSPVGRERPRHPRPEHRRHEHGLLLAGAVGRGDHHRHGRDLAVFHSGDARRPERHRLRRLGPVITGAGHTPNVLFSTNSLTVTSLVAQAFSPIADVTLHYRVMFNAEVAVPMNDAGTNGDVAAGDGVWTGVIPAGVVSPGQLLRYYVTATDAAGNLSRWPIFPDALESEQYLRDSRRRPDHSDSAAGGVSFRAKRRCGRHHHGHARFDVLSERTLRQSHRSVCTARPPLAGRRKAITSPLPKDHQFLYQPSGVSREKNIMFMSNYGDKTRMHTTLTYASGRDERRLRTCSRSRSACSATARSSALKTWSSDGDDYCA